MYELIKKKAVYFPDPQRHNIAMSENCKNFITRVSPLTLSKFHLTILIIFHYFSVWRNNLQIAWEPEVVWKKSWPTHGSQSSTTRRSLTEGLKRQFALSLHKMSSMSATLTQHSLRKRPWSLSLKPARWRPSIITNANSITFERWF